MGDLLVIFLSAVLIHNVILNRFLGICPFVGVSKGIDASIGMGMAVTFVMTLSSIATWLVHHYILVPLDLIYMRTIAFILVIAFLVQFVEMVIAKTSPVLHRALGIYLPLITTNCAVLGIAILNIQKDLNLIQTAVHALGAALGFGLALILIASIRVRLFLADVPEALKGAPMAFILSGLLAIAFMGFIGML